MIFGKIQNIHFVGIGGIGMSGIAEVLVNLGYTVSGSDIKNTSITKRLESLGIQIMIGHETQFIKNAQVVVISSAIKDNNPEVLAAHAANLPVIPRGEMLAELMRMKYGIAISGSHGKTTTTSMLAQILSYSGVDPTVVIGGKLGTIGSNAKLGNGSFLVAEADESDGSFLLLSPTISIITNIDIEHVDYYKDLDDIKNAFLKFGNKVPFYGSVFACIDDHNVAELIPKFKRRVYTYGTSPKANIVAVDVIPNFWCTKFHVNAHGKDLGLFSIGVPGHHMVLNALATIGVALDLNINLDCIKNGLANFTGAERRFQKRGEINNILIIDDYGHHPTEIVATLKTARQIFPNRRIIVAFQPHRYTRTARLLPEFSQALSYADKILITDIYAAGEQPIPGLSSLSIVDAIITTSKKDVCYVPDVKNLTQTLASITKSGDIVITMGAGTITSISLNLLELLKKKI